MPKKFSRIAVATFAIPALLLVACTRGTAPPTSGAGPGVESVGLSRIAISDRQLAPPLSGTTLKGSHFALADFTGNLIVVNVWASWCEPCRTESPVLAGLERQMAAQKVRFVGIDESDTTSTATRFIASTGARYPQLVDTDGILLGQLHLLPQKGIPSTLILDRHGRMAARVIGPVTGGEVQALVSELLLEN